MNLTKNGQKSPFYINQQINPNQGRTFGPLLGLFLTNLIAKVITAKYISSIPYHLEYDPNPWLAYNKPMHVYPTSYIPPEWYPIKNPYNSYQYPVLTTENSDLFTLNHELNHYEDLEGEFSNRIETNISKPPEVIFAESNKNSRRRRPESRRTTKRPYKNQGNRGKRRRTTTTTPDYDTYYDSYEEDYDYTTEKQRRRPYYQSYEESYEDSFEQTTKYRKRPNKRRMNNREKTTQPNYYDILERESPTEIVIVRQRQATTTTTDPPTTSTLPTTLITNETTTETTTTVNSTSTTANSTFSGYGYGPSNGYEEISITYGPPFKYHYSAPYSDWYNHQATRNSIIRKVQNIVGFDHII